MESIYPVIRFVFFFPRVILQVFFGSRVIGACSLTTDTRFTVVNVRTTKQH